MTDQALLSVTVLALVEETHQSWVGKKTLALEKPKISISVPKAGEHSMYICIYTAVNYMYYY